VVSWIDKNTITVADSMLKIPVLAPTKIWTPKKGDFLGKREIFYIRKKPPFLDHFEKHRKKHRIFEK